MIGPTSTFSALLFATDPTTNAQFSVTLNQCVASKFSFDTNIEDFAKPDFEFQAFANAAGQVMTFNFGDALERGGVRHIAWRKDVVGSASSVPRDQGYSAGAVRRLSLSWRRRDVGANPLRVSTRPSSIASPRRLGERSRSLSPSFPSQVSRPRVLGRRTDPGLSVGG